VTVPAALLLVLLLVLAVALLLLEGQVLQGAGDYCAAC
jgi:hypothetical protein